MTKNQTFKNAVRSYAEAHGISYTAALRYFARSEQADPYSWASWLRRTTFNEQWARDASLWALSRDDLPTTRNLDVLWDYAESLADRVLAANLHELYFQWRKEAKLGDRFIAWWVGMDWEPSEDPALEIPRFRLDPNFPDDNDLENALGYIRAQNATVYEEDEIRFRWGQWMLRDALDFDRDAFPVWAMQHARIVLRPMTDDGWKADIPTTSWTICRPGYLMFTGVRDGRQIGNRQDTWKHWSFHTTYPTNAPEHALVYEAVEETTGATSPWGPDDVKGYRLGASLAATWIDPDKD
jgi:hypothetical protein